MEYTTETPLYIRVSEKMQTKGEINTDLILPDSYEDVRRILHATASICPERSELSSGKLLSEGKVLIDLLFEDDTGKIGSVSFNRDYKITCNAEKNENENRIICLPAADSLSVKLLNPRKIGARLTVDTCARLWEESSPALEMPEAFTPSDRLTVEKKEEYAESLCVHSVFDSARQISEDIELGRSDMPIEKILLADLSVGVDKTVRTGDNLDIKGSVRLCTLYQDGEGELWRKDSEIPFSQTVDVSGIPDSEGCEYIARVYVDQKSVQPGENAFGELKVMELDFSCVAYVVQLCPCKVKLTKDAFSTEYCTENRMSRVRSAFLVPAVADSQSRRVQAEWDGDKKAVCMFSECNIRSEDPSSLTVNVKFTLLLEGSGKNHSTVTVSDSFPLQTDGMSECFAWAQIAEEKMISDNGKAEITYTVSSEAKGWRLTDTSYVSGIELCENTDSTEMRAMNIYYPQNGETLWDVAKKYRISENALMCCNGMNEESGMRRVLLIPKRRRSVISKII